MTFPTQLLGFTNQATDQIAYSRITLGAGTTEFTVPDGVFQISGVVIGGGGGGNGSDGTGINTSNGGSGGALCWGTFSVMPGDVLKLDIAAGGVGGNPADAAGGNGFEGGNSGIFLVERNGNDYRSAPIEILFAEGGDGGVRTSPGGAGGQGLATNTVTPEEITIYDSDTGTGGRGGFVPSGAAVGGGGGGCGGYTGNGGNGGNNNLEPTDSATGSGGGGGGGSQGNGLGFGGGGSGSFGFDEGTQGDAGINDTSGGTGGSFFEDPGLGIRAQKVGETIAVTGPGITTIAIPPGTQDDDFLLLLSGADKDSGLPINQPFPVPVGFTTFNQSQNGEYYINYDEYIKGPGVGITEAIASNTPIIYQNRDLNFANSYQYVEDITSFVEDPPGSGQRCISGLTNSPAIHNLISLRFIPNPAQINWVATSGDPSINSTPTATSMPDPPSISGISSGSIAIALGYLANTTINPSGNIAPTGYTAVPDVADNSQAAPQTTSCIAAYKQITSTGTENPGEFLTGTASHARAYTLELESNGSTIQFVGYGTVTQGDSNFNIGTELRDASGNIFPTNQMQTNDLIVVATSKDNPSNPRIPELPSGTDMTSFTVANSVGGATETSFGREGDIRQIANPTDVTPGLAYGIWYSRYSGSDNIVDIDNTTGTAPAASLVMVFRNVDTVGSPFQQTPTFLDTNDIGAGIAGAPNPPQQNMTSGNMSLIIGMIDDQKVSLVDVITAPTDQVDSIDYTMLSQASYGEQNNGLIIMSAIREDCKDTTNPSSFVANGSNIWSSQTIVIGGPGSQTGGTSTSAGQYGGGGGGRSQNSNGRGMNGADGAVRLIWGSSRLYPFRGGNTGNFTLIDFVP